MTAATDTGRVAFALRTGDEQWITRNHAVIGEAGRVFVQVPADEVELVKFAGTPMVRHVFTDCPADAVNAAISCPAAWVPETAAQKAAAR